MLIRIATKCRTTLCCLLAVAAIAASRPAVAGEEATIKAFAAWQGQGVTSRTGATEATFIGLLSGVMYVETENGLLASGRMTCPVILEIGMSDGKQHGQGRCTITAKDGAQIFSELACDGVYLLGCNGTLKLTDGTDRFKGISGDGKVTIRSDARLVTATVGDANKEEGTGSLYLPALTYKLP
jgi:hypothetical protein